MIFEYIIAPLFGPQLGRLGNRPTNLRNFDRDTEPGGRAYSKQRRVRVRCFRVYIGGTDRLLQPTGSHPADKTSRCIPQEETSRVVGTKQNEETPKCVAETTRLSVRIADFDSTCNQPQTNSLSLSLSLFLSFSLYLSLSRSFSLSFSVYLGAQATRPRMQRAVERFSEGRKGKRNAAVRWKFQGIPEGDR